MKLPQTTGLRFAHVLTSALALCLTLTGMLPAAEDLTARYFDQLRQRRLFSLAEGFCLSRLSVDDLSLGRRSSLTIELSRTYSEHARYTSGREQRELWQRSTAAIDELLESSPGNTRRLLLKTQRALALSAQGEHLRWQAELFPFDKTLRSRGIAALDQARAQLKAVEKEADEQSRRRTPRRTAKAERLSPYELKSLSYQLQHQIGRTLIERAKFDPPGSPDRISYLLEAEPWLERLANSAGQPQLALASRLLLAESSRLRGDRRKAADIVKSLRKADPAAELRDRITALEARLLIDDGRAADAALLLSRYRVERLRLTGELLYLQIEALSALWDVAEEQQQPKLAAQLTEQIEAYADRAAAEAGGFWAYRCRLLVESMQETKRYGAELAGVVREARSLYAAGKFREAIQAYGRALDAAKKSGQGEIAMEVGYVRASVQLHVKDYEAAAESFRRLADRHPSSSKAADAHLLSAYSLGRAYQERRTKARRERYTDALVRHREQFPEHGTRAEATWMLALLEERRLQVTRALKLYREIPADHSRGPLAQLAVARCYEKILDRVRELKRPLDAWENDAVARLEQMTATYLGVRQPLSREQTEVCLRFARICLNRREPDYERAERLLDRIEESRRRRAQQDEAAAKTQKSDLRWNLLHQAATQLRIVTLAGRGRFEEARLLVQGLSESKPREVLGILDGLSDLTADAHPKTRHQLGELQLSAARDLDGRRAGLNRAEQRRLDHCLAQAYAATGRSSQAIAVYESLLSKSPNDRKLLKTIAELLTDCGTRECLMKAKPRWRKLESLETAGEAEWMNARYRVAYCSCALKQYSECRKLLDVTRLVYPGLGGEALRTRFAELEKELPVRQ